MGLSLSPNGVVAVKLSPEGEIQISPMEYVYGSLDHSQAPRKCMIYIYAPHSSPVTNVICKQ